MLASVSNTLGVGGGVLAWCLAHWGWMGGVLALVSSTLGVGGRCAGLGVLQSSLLPTPL